MDTFRETDLYEPVRRFLEEEGYTVQAEVKGCDVAAVKNGQLVIVELKKAFNLRLVYQALERQSRTELVFVAIPRPKNGQREKAWKDMLRLLKRLGLGLLTVAIDSPLRTVDVVLEPSDSIAWKNRKKRERLQAEWDGRQTDANTGGMTRRKIMTAFREKSLHLCCLIEKYGEISTAQLKDWGLVDGYAAILSRNYYRWFRRVAKGCYTLSEEGQHAILEEDYRKTVEFYRNEGEK